MISLLLLAGWSALAADTPPVLVTVLAEPEATDAEPDRAVLSWAGRTRAQRRTWRTPLEPMPAPSAAVDVAQLRPLQDTVGWSWFGLRLLADVIDPWLIEPTPDTALVPGAPKTSDRCVPAPPDVGIDPIEPDGTLECLAPPSARPGTPLRVTPRFYEDGRMGVQLTGSL